MTGVQTCALPIYAGPFTLTASATVKAKAWKTGLTPSAVASANFTITPTLSNLTLTPSLEALLAIPPSTPFSLIFLDPGTSNVRHSSSYTTNASGRIVIASLPIPAGTYDIRVASSYSLSRKMIGALLASGATLTLPTLFAGDLDQNNAVNTLDWGMMNTKWFTNDPVADINQDTLVNTIDFSYMNRNWGRTGE